MSTVGLWHYPATITDPTTTVEIAAFAPATGGDASDSQFTTTSTAAVINTFGTRQQLVWFTSWATDWAATSNFIMHAHIHWLTRGLCKSPEIQIAISIHVTLAHFNQTSVSVEYTSSPKWTTCILQHISMFQMERASELVRQTWPLT